MMTWNLFDSPAKAKVASAAGPIVLMSYCTEWLNVLLTSYIYSMISQSEGGDAELSLCGGPANHG